VRGGVRGRARRQAMRRWAAVRGAEGLTRESYSTNIGEGGILSL